MEKIIRLSEVIKNLELGDFGEEIFNYDTTYIYDILSEIAGSNANIYDYDTYYCDIKEFIKKHMKELNKSIDQFGWQSDIYKQRQIKQYEFNIQQLYDNLEDIIKAYAYNYMVEELEIEEVSEEFFNNLNIELEEMNSENRCEEIKDLVNELLEKF